MSTSIYRNKNCRRPKKTGSAKRKRIASQRRRLIGLGVSEAKLRTMTSKDVRDMLRRPEQVSV